VKRRIYFFAKTASKYVLKTFSFLAERLYKGLKDGLFPFKLIAYLFLLCVVRTPAFSVLKTFIYSANSVGSFNLIIKLVILVTAIIKRLINAGLTTSDIYIAYIRLDLIMVF
jgi:hypothetical protein